MVKQRDTLLEERTDWRLLRYSRHHPGTRVQWSYRRSWLRVRGLGVKEDT